MQPMRIFLHINQARCSSENCIEGARCYEKSMFGGQPKQLKLLCWNCPSKSHRRSYWCLTEKRRSPETLWANKFPSRSSCTASRILFFYNHETSKLIEFLNCAVQSFFNYILQPHRFCSLIEKDDHSAAGLALLAACFDFLFLFLVVGRITLKLANLLTHTCRNCF